MTAGRKTGGRKPGSKNRRTLAVEELIAASGCNPISFMCRLVDDEDAAPELRFAAAKELSGYLFSKKRTIAVETSTSVTFNLLEIVESSLARSRERQTVITQNQSIIEHEAD